MNCQICYEDIDYECHDNISPICGYPVCEDCGSSMTPADWLELENRLREEGEI